MAAGLTVHPNNLDALRGRLNDLARRTVKPEFFQPTIRLDAEVALSQLTMDRLPELNQMQPLGQGNPAVQLIARRLTHQRSPQRMGRDQQHLKMWVTDGAITREAVWWNCSKAEQPAGRFNLAFTAQINEFNGRATVQLKVLDWEPA